LSNNVNSILKKGFVLIEQDEKIIKRKTELKIDRGLELKFYDGNVSLNK
jgi:exonuclease VII large subunit